MKRFLFAASTAVILSATATSGFAKTTTVNFENVDQSNAPLAPLLTGGDYLTQSGYYFQFEDINGATGSLVGALMNGADAGSCLNGICPTGDTTNYIGALNDGYIDVGKVNGDTIRLLSFDAAFLATPDEPSLSTSALLGVQAERADGSFALSFFNLGPLVSGSPTAFQNFQITGGQSAGGTGTLTSGDVTDYIFYAYFCDQTGSCKAFQTNNGQFALDNLVFASGDPAAPVPEPASWAMMIGGVGLAGGMLRRRYCKSEQDFTAKIRSIAFNAEAF